MTLLSRTELNRLIEPPAGPSVSLYLPTHRLGPEIQQDPIRLKNLIREAERRLLDLGLRSPEAAELLRPAWRLQSDGLFWRHQREGLAIFLSTEIEVHYRLPLGVEELVVVADRFHARPLTTPRQVRHTISYVLNNWRHHGEDRARYTRTWKADPFSSGAVFSDWKELEDSPVLWPLRTTYYPLLVWRPRTWLLATGWKEHHPLISVREVPGR